MVPSMTTHQYQCWHWISHKHQNTEISELFLHWANPQQKICHRQQHHKTQCDQSQYLIKIDPTSVGQHIKLIPAKPEIWRPQSPEIGIGRDTQGNSVSAEFSTAKPQSGKFREIPFLTQLFRFAGDSLLMRWAQVTNRHSHTHNKLTFYM